MHTHSCGTILPFLGGSDRICPKYAQITTLVNLGDLNVDQLPRTSLYLFLMFKLAVTDDGSAKGQISHHLQVFPMKYKKVFKKMKSSAVANLNGTVRKEAFDSFPIGHFPCSEHSTTTTPKQKQKKTCF